ncbi:hypothetical protein, partial [Pseudoalteromonas sp. KS88]|uniref:hypothetical protein n=1 Tax=Pseudoalteromonas sp. KS88 TaxID=2109918 RepID=UPI001AEBFB17
LLQRMARIIIASPVLASTNKHSSENIKFHIPIKQRASPLLQQMARVTGSSAVLASTYNRLID